MIAYFEVEERPEPGLMRRIKWRLNPQSRMETQTRCVKNAAFWQVCWPVEPGLRPEELEKQVRRGLGLLRQRGVHRAAAAERWREAIVEAGLAPVTEDRLWPAVGFQAAIAELQARQADLDKTWVCVAARRADRDVVRCVRSLASKVRYLSVQAQVGEEYLADMLYQEFGVARQSIPPPEYARLRVAFPGAEPEEGLALVPGGCPGLRLLAPDWARAQKPAGMAEELYAAMLLENGLIRPQDVRALPAENRA